MNPPINGFHIEPTNICTLKCAGCPRTQFIEKWPQHWKNYSLDVDSVLNFLDVDLADKTINLCGNYGDPIYHPDFIELVKRFKQRHGVVSIVTNGSYRTQEWWNNLTQLLEARDTVTFSIDGLPDNFTQYRKNADWTSIELAIKTCVQSACGTVWSYIPFNFNKQHIESARQLALQMGIDQFVVDFSDRYDQFTEHLKPTDIELLGPRYQAMQNWKLQYGISDIRAKCQNGLEHFISASGHYTSCCYTANHNFYYKTVFGKNQKKFNITDQTFSDILKSSELVEFYQTLSAHSVCQYNCPKTHNMVDL